MDSAQHREARLLLTAALVDALTRLWQGLGSWHRSDVDTFLSRALPLIRAQRRMMGQITAMRVAATASDFAGTRVAPPSTGDRYVVDPRDGVTDAEVYERPFHEVWTALRDDSPLEKAVEQGLQRLTGIVETDMQLAHSQALSEAQQRLPERVRPRWWERTLQGEESCLLCVVASTRVYRVGELNPLHPGCDCEVEERFTRPPRELHPERLTAAYSDAAEAGYDGTSGEMLRDIFASHGETGPTLIDPAARKREARAKKRAELARTN